MSIKAQRNYDKIPHLDIVRMHAHDDYEIYCFLKGDAEYMVEGNYYKLKSGDILIMKRGEAHSLIIKSLKPYERYVVNFTLEEILGEGREEIISFISERPLGKYNQFPASSFRDKNWIYYLEQMVNEEENAKRIYLTVLLQELKNAYPHIKNKQPKTADFSNVIAYINEHLTDNISLEDICRYSFLSKSQLNRKFKAFTGSTVWEYITVKRLILAKGLLQMGHRPSAVYLECGFNEYTTFYRAYKARFSSSPARDCVKNN